MALPTSMTTSPIGTRSLTGIVLGIFPSTNRTLTVELQTATAAAAASSLWRSILFQPTAEVRLEHTAYLPLSTRTAYFRARHPAQPGFSAGAFTPTVSAKPTKLGPRLPIGRPLLTNKGNVEMPSGSDVFVSSAKTVKVGTQVTTARQIRTMRIPGAEFVAQTSTQSWKCTAGILVTNAVATSRFFVAPLVLPRGTILTAVRQRRFLLDPADIANMQLAKLSSASTFTQLALAGLTTTGGTSGWQTDTSTAISHAISTAASYILRSALRNNASTVGARLMWAEVDITVGQYDQAL